MNKNFNVAILQIGSLYNQEQLLINGINACRQAKKQGADIAVFPEMYNIGYNMSCENYNNELDMESEKQLIEGLMLKSISKDDKYIITFKNLAKELNMAIAITLLEKNKPLPKNTIIIFDKDGKEVLKYSKIHTVDFKIEKYIQPGENFEVTELDYGRGTVKIGSMICFDRSFPESAEILMLKGAEIVLVPNACQMTNIRLDQLKVRAYENMLGIVTVNYCDYGGRSSAFSPIVRDKNKNELDSEILVMDSNEDIKIVGFDLDEIRKYRKREAFGNAYRKPWAYSELLKNYVKEPFIRADSRRDKNV